MINWYFFIKENEVTQEMITYSTSLDTSLTKSMFFPSKGATFVFLKVEDRYFDLCTCFDKYRAYTHNEALKIIQEEEKLS